MHEKLKSRTFWMANGWGVIFSVLLVGKYMDPMTYAGLMTMVFVTFGVKSLKEKIVDLKANG